MGILNLVEANEVLIGLLFVAASIIWAGWSLSRQNAAILWRLGVINTTLTSMEIRQENIDLSLVSIERQSAKPLFR